MQNAPKIVSERLRAAPAVGNHPDADALTAFAERSLPELERTVVLEHVSRCRDCRNVIALALPETETAILTPSPARRPWLTWPALRWGFVAAGVVAIASLGVLQLQRRSEVSALVAKESRSQTAAPASATQPLPQAAPTDAASTDKLAYNKVAPAAPGPDASAELGGSPKRTEPRVRPAPEPTVIAGARPPHSSPFVASPSRGTIGGSFGGPLQHGPKMPQQWQQQIPSQANGAAVAAPALVANQTGNTAANKIPAASEMVEVQAEAVQLDTLTQNQSAQSGQAGEQQSAADETTVGKAKLPVPAERDNAALGQTLSVVQAAPSNAAQNAPLSGRNFTQLVELSPAPRWSITAAGGLQRSLDQGKSWQSVDVNAAPTFAESATTPEVVANSRAEKKDSARKTQKQAVPAPSSLVFRAITATGAEVWVGGSSGVLYHSVDAGARWIRVMPVSSGIPLTSDILAVEFSDPQHGRITTSSAEVWTTADDGQTWQKQ